MAQPLTACPGGAAVIKFWGPPAPILLVDWGPHITGRLGAPVVNLGPPIHSLRPLTGRLFRHRMSMPVSVFGYKTSAENAESLMYHGGDREGKPIY